MAERSAQLGRIAIGAVALVLIGAAFGVGFLVADRTGADDADTATAPTATATSVADSSGPAASFVVNDTLPGRVLMTRTDCSGDGTVVATFLWTRPAGQESDRWRLLIAPLGQEDDLSKLDDAIVRPSNNGQAKIGGLAAGSQFGVKIIPGTGDEAWARGALTTPLCNQFGSACPPSSDLLAQGPVSGSTTDTNARIWVRTCYPASVVLEYRETGAPLAAGIATSPQRTDPQQDNTAVFEIAGLRPSQSYDYRVLVDSIPVPHPAASFWTMPAPGTPTKLRFVTGSDLHQIRPQNRVANLAMPEMLRAQPQFALLLGDNIDVDGFGKFNPTATEAYLRHYRDNWSFAPMRNLLAGVSTRMMWDDHDIINDWDQLDAAPYPFAREAFGIFVSRQNPDPVREGSTYFTFDAGDVSFFVLDVRSFRSPKRQADDAQKSMLGEQQKADLKEWMTTSTAKFKFIASGVQWNDHQVVPLRENDAWDGFRTEREEILDFINESGVDGVMLLSGDAHWPGVIRHSHGIIEFQTTPVGVSPPAPPPSVAGAADVIFADGQKNVFGRFDVDTTASPARIDFAMVDRLGVELFKLTLTETDLAR